MTSSPERSAAYSQWQSGGGFETLGDFEPWWAGNGDLNGTFNGAANILPPPGGQSAGGGTTDPTKGPGAGSVDIGAGTANTQPLTPQEKAPLPLADAPIASPKPTAPALTGGGVAGGFNPMATPDPLAFTPPVASTPTPAATPAPQTPMIGGFGGMLAPSAPIETTPAQQPDAPSSGRPTPAPTPLPLAPTPTAAPTPAPISSPSFSPSTPNTPAVGSGSQIFANDPTRPGAGYVMVNGVPYRIEGTTAAGLNPDGSPKAVGGSQYLLDDGHGGVINGPSVNESDYNAWMNAPHGADTAGGPSGSAPPPAPAPTPTPAPAPTPQPTPAPSGSALTASAGQGINEANPRAPTPSPAPSLPGGSLSGGTLDPHPAIPSPTPIPSQPTAPSGPVETAPPQPTDGNGLPVASSPPPSTAAAPAPTPPAAPAVPPLTVPAPVQAPVPLDANGLPSQSASQTGNQGSGVSLSPTTPGNSLLNSTITPGPGTDRYAIAQKEYNDWVAQSDPQFLAAMRDANRYSAAAGRIGSGQATNSIGDIQTQRENSIRSARDSFLGNALNSSVDDAYKNVGIEQQQQQFQEGQQQTGFNQNMQLQTLANSEQGQQFSQLMQSLGFNAQQMQQAFQNAYATQQLSNSQDAQSFYQALQQEILGMQGDPAQILAWISGQYARGAAA